MKEKDDGTYKVLSYYNLVAVVSVLLVVFTSYYIFTNIAFIKNNGIGFYGWLNNQSPFLAGAIGVWILGVATFIIRGVPEKILQFTIKQSTIELTLNNVDEVYDNFLRWYHNSGRSSRARTLVAKNRDYKWKDAEVGEFHDMDISAGYGKHYFIYGGRVFQLYRNEKDASQTKEIKESITITTIGRSQDQFHELLRAITPANVYQEATHIYKWSGEYWNRVGTQAARNFDSVILPDNTKNIIVNHITTFLNERDWYMEHGIPYRTGIILHGIPGTGKTSLVRALCDKFEKPLYILNLHGLSDSTLENAFDELPCDSLVLIEDIDTYTVTASRSPDDPSGEALALLTLGGLLNAIDGVIASDGRILIATTNHLDALDTALTRKGRFNLPIEIGHLTHDCVLEFFNSFYPGFEPPHKIRFRNDIVPAELQALILDNITTPDNVLKYCTDEKEIDTGEI